MRLAVAQERPVGEEAGPHQIFLRHGAPYAAVGAVVAVVAEGEILPRLDRECFVGKTEIGACGLAPNLLSNLVGIATVKIVRSVIAAAHHAPKSSLLREMAVVKKLRRVNPEFVAGDAA